MTIIYHQDKSGSVCVCVFAHACDCGHKKMILSLIKTIAIVPN